MPKVATAFDPAATTALQLLSVEEAAHFCRPIAPGVAYKTSVLKQYLAGLPKQDAKFTQPSADFELLRAILLADAERSLFLATSNFRRAHDLLRVGSAGWCLTTLYYAAFHAAESILAMFGGFVDRDLGTIEVVNGTPGKQELMVFRKKGSRRWPYRIGILTTFSGTHDVFWDVFFKAVVGLRSFVGNEIAEGLRPVSGDPRWLTITRNDVNYSPLVSLTLSNEFAQRYKIRDFPGCLPARLADTHSTAYNLVRAAHDFARQIKLKTDALDCLPDYKGRTKAVQDHIFSSKAPDWAKLGLRIQL